MDKLEKLKLGLKARIIGAIFMHLLMENKGKGITRPEKLIKRVNGCIEDGCS